MGMAVGGSESGFVADINVTPMVDVMLVLLIIFMVIAPMLQSGVSVTLPKSLNPELDPNIVKETSAVVSVPEDGKYYVGRDPASLSDLGTKIKNILRDKPAQEQVVYIKSGTLVKYGTVVTVIDAIREAGFETIGLVSEKEKDEKGGPTGGSPP
ncbi:MAG TPA: biopolymer transporter ExbD [Blastocatellia bacterium]|nr:biopolymer transporter ExbD [Blastocatellia bacterium]